MPLPSIFFLTENSFFGYRVKEVQRNSGESEGKVCMYVCMYVRG